MDLMNSCLYAFSIYPGVVHTYCYIYHCLQCVCRGSLKYYTKQYKSAIEDLTTAVNLDRQCSLVYFNRALCQQALGNTEKVAPWLYIIHIINNMSCTRLLLTTVLCYL